jgi:hypothetical protein
MHPTPQQRRMQARDGNRQPTASAYESAALPEPVIDLAPLDSNPDFLANLPMPTVEYADTVIAQRGDSISTILDTSNPVAVEAFMRANGLSNSTIQAGRAYVLPTSEDYAASNGQLGQTVLNQDNARLATNSQAKLDQDLTDQAIAGGVGTWQFNRAIESAFNAQLANALTPQPGIDPRTGLRAGPTPENAIALGYESRPDYYSDITAEMWPWDGKVAGQLVNPLGLDAVRAGSWHYQQAANLSSALPVLPAAGGYSLGARFVAGQLAKQPLTQLGTAELLKGMGISGSVSTGLYLLVNQKESTPAGVAVAFGSGAFGGGAVKQSMNYWAALPNTAIPVSWSNAVTQAVGSAYGFSIFGVWNASGTTATGDSWWTRPIIAPTLPETVQSR